MINKNWKKPVILFLTGQMISLFGSALVQYAITWYITLTTQSGSMMTIAIICGFIPILLISPFGGVWADRYNKKFLIIMSDALIAVFTLALALLFMMGNRALWLLFAVSAVRAVGSGIQSPTIGAFIPSIVPQEKLTKVNGIASSLQAVVSLVSPIISGALLTVASIEIIFFIDVVTAALAIAIMIFFLRVKEDKKEKPQKSAYFSDLREGVKYIGKHKFVRTMFIFCGIFFLLVGPLAFLTPLQVTRNFGNDVWRLTVVEVAFSSGMILGGILIALWGGFKNRVHTLVFSNFIISGCVIALGLVPIFWIYAGVLLFAGISFPMFNTPFTVILQEKVDGAYLGRVFSVMNMISSSLMPLAMLFYGPIADYVKIEYLLIATGSLMFVQTLFMAKSKTLINAGIRVEKSENSYAEGNSK